MIDQKRLLERFIRYVKVDSLSKQEGRFAKLIKRELRGLGLPCREDKAGKRLPGQSGNLFTAIKGNVRGIPRILFNAHLDTVGPGRGIRPRIRKGVITSDGSTILGADNKAGVAVIMEIIRIIKEKKLPHGDIDIIFTVAEEMGLCGSKFIDKAFMNADLGYVLDGGDVDEIINKAPSQDSLDARIIGRAAHAGVHPEQGINAIKVASDAISRMRLGRIDKETTANIGIIKGGEATNIVPETVEIRGEARSHSRKKLARQVSHMKKALISACRRYKAKLECRISSAYRSFEIPLGHKALTIAKLAAAASGIRPKIKATGGGSDANIFNGLGVPCVIIGVGADNVHTKKENIKIKEMAKGAQFVLNIINESLKCSKKR